MRIVGALSGSLNPWSPAVRRDPYPAYAALRSQPGLARLRLFGGYVATRYADVEHVLRDAAFSTNRNAMPRVRAPAGDLLRHAAARGEMEVMRDLANPLPAVVIAELLGVPADEHERFAARS